MARPVYAARPSGPSKLEPFKGYLGERLQAGVWNARVLFRELLSRNYTGGYTILTDFLRPQRVSSHGSRYGASKRRRANRRRQIGAIWARWSTRAARDSCGASLWLWATAGS